MKVVPVLTTYMEMKKRPEQDLEPPIEGTSLERVKDLTVEDYRKLYKSVGERYNWIDRIIMEENDLLNIIESDDSEINIFKVDGEIAGYFEINRKDPANVEIVYMGLLQRFHGKGLGSFLLNRGLGLAWRENTQRVWLHTCEWDHEGSIPMYMKAGFTIFKEESHQQKVPDDVEWKKRNTFTDIKDYHVRP